MDKPLHQNPLHHRRLDQQQQQKNIGTQLPSHSDQPFPSDKSQQPWLLIADGNSQQSKLFYHACSSGTGQQQQVIASQRKPESVSINKKCMNDSYQPCEEDDELGINLENTSIVDCSQLEGGGSEDQLVMGADSIELKVEDLVKNTSGTVVEFGGDNDAASSIERNYNNESLSMSEVREEQLRNQNSENRGGNTRVQQQESSGMIASASSNHQRMLSDYVNQQQQEDMHGSSAGGISEQSTTNPSSKLSPGEELILHRQRFLNKLQIGIQLCQAENYEEALHEYLSLVQSPIITQEGLNNFSPFKAVLYYNKACCYHRLGMIKECIQAMKEALITLEDQALDTSDDREESMNSEINHITLGANVEIFNQDSFFSKSLQLCERVTLQRHLCRMTLQLCAIMSQTNSHLVALDLAIKADQHARNLINYSKMLCSDYLKYLQYQHRLEAEENGNNLTGSHPQPVNKQEYEDESDYAPTYIKDQNWQLLAKNQQVWQNLRRGSESTYNGPRTTSNSAYKFYNTHQRFSRVHNFSEVKRDSSFLSKSSVKSSSSKTSIKIQRRSVSKGDGGSTQQDNQSLERVHTFHLKKSPSNESKLFPMTPNHVPEKVDRVYYVQEITKASDETLVRNIQPIINELAKRIIKDPESTKHGYSSLKAIFNNEKEIDEMKSGSKSFKLSIRSVLGLQKASISNVSKLKHNKQKDDQWIYQLNIGNIMYLQPIEIDELLKLEESKKFNMQSSELRITDSSPFSNINTKNGSTPSLRQYGRCVTPSVEDITERIKHELSKEEMLEKIVLIVVCLFCLGTELRFKYQQNLKCTEYPAKTEEIRVQSECCHANAIHLASLFIPDECPLVPHMINSYKKHHLKNRPFIKIPTEQEEVKQSNVPKKVVEIVLRQKIEEKKETPEDQAIRKKAKLIDQLMNYGFNSNPNVVLMGQQRQIKDNYNSNQRPPIFAKGSQQMVKSQANSNKIPVKKQSYSKLLQMSKSPLKPDIPNNNFSSNLAPVMLQGKSRNQVLPSNSYSLNSPPEQPIILESMKCTTNSSSGAKKKSIYQSPRSLSKTSRDQLEQQNRISPRVMLQSPPLPRRLNCSLNQPTMSLSQVMRQQPKEQQNSRTNMALGVLQREFGTIKRPSESTLLSKNQSLNKLHSVIGNSMQHHTMEEMLQRFDQLSYRLGKSNIPSQSSSNNNHHDVNSHQL